MGSRHKTRLLRVGNVPLGGDSPVVVQSMTNTDTRDVAATVAQIERLVAGGCELVRVAVPDERAAEALRAIIDKVNVPLIADIHFDYRLALRAIENGVAALRINPGNIGGEAKLNTVVDAAKAHACVIRIGVNGGSLEKDILRKYGSASAKALVESALAHVRLLEKRHFYETKISIKSSAVRECVTAYRELAAVCDYPLHIGITEAGGLVRGAVKSAVGLGILLWEGIGDTLRVSLTAPPEKELPVAWEILRALDLRRRGPEIISCPTCGRTEIDLFALAQQVEDRLAHETADIKVAVMGCVVNGPGEAREADLGVAGGRDRGIIFRKGEVVRSVSGQEALLTAFMEELAQLLNEKGQA